MWENGGKGEILGEKKRKIFTVPGGKISFLEMGKNSPCLPNVNISTE